MTPYDRIRSSRGRRMRSGVERLFSRLFGGFYELLKSCRDYKHKQREREGPHAFLPFFVTEHDKQLEGIELTDGSPVGDGRSPRSKRSTAHISNNEYTIEVMVAVDKKMQEYHKDTLKSYVLTLMSIVSVFVIF